MQDSLQEAVARSKTIQRLHRELPVGMPVRVIKGESEFRGDCGVVVAHDWDDAGWPWVFVSFYGQGQDVREIPFRVEDIERALTLVHGGKRG